MSAKPKAAIVLRGLMRNWKMSYDSIMRNLIEPYDADIFIWVWNEVGYYQGKQYLQKPEDEFVKLADNDKGFLEGETINMNEVWEFYSPKILHVENFTSQEHIFNEKTKYFKNALTRPKNTICQFYTIKKSLEMMFSYAQENQIHYDYVVSLRPDILLQSDLPKLQKDAFYTLPSRNSKNRGTGDSLIIGDMLTMRAFQDVYDSLELLYDNFTYSCPHEFVEYFAKQANWQELNGVNATVTHSRNGIAYQESDNI